MMMIELHTWLSSGTILVLFVIRLKWKR